MTALDLSHPLVVGFGVTGQAVTRALINRGVTPVVIDDNPNTTIATFNPPITMIEAPSLGELTRQIEHASVLLPSPGIPARHPMFDLAIRTATPVRSEFDLAALWDDRPLVGITGTNGKTTVTMVVTDALNRSGIKAAAVGNTPVPLVQAIDNVETQVFVVEASSFRLAHSDHFAPKVATWLNFSPDHLDAHPTLDAYEMAKADLWGSLPDGAVAIANAEDEVVMRHLPSAVEVQTFGLGIGDWRIDDGYVVGPDGPIVPVGALPRRQPHDLANATAIAATASAAGAPSTSIADALTAFQGLPHRVQFVGEWEGVRWFNDSKATVPHATLAATGGFPSVVLIAGGRNKGLDLSPLIEAIPPVKAIVAIGDASDEVAGVVAGRVPLVKANNMTDAVAEADRLATAGDTVLLSPACTSFDWYASYRERGDDFIRIVTARFS